MNACLVDACGSPHHARDMCLKHYKRWRKTPAGAAQASQPPPTPRERFESRVSREGSCWTWTGPIGADGYGSFSVHGKTVWVHRFAYEQEHGPIPDGLQVDHTCWSRACVNVEHLRIATRAENLRNRRGALPSSSTGVRNVHPDGRGGYRVTVKKNGKRHFGGSFRDLSTAADAAERMRADLFGEFAGTG